MRRSVADRVNNSQDVIDSRDIVDRIEELEIELQSVECGACGDTGGHTEHEDTPEQENVPCEACKGVGSFDLTVMDANAREAAGKDCQALTDEHEELLRLRALVEEIDNTAGDNSRDGVGLIRDSYFEDYARDLHEDINGRDAKSGWPYDYIDWEAASEALQQDYSVVDFDGVTYWVRS